MDTVADIGETITTSLGPWGAPSCVVALDQGAGVTSHVGGRQADTSPQTLFGIASVSKTRIVPGVRPHLVGNRKAAKPGLEGDGPSPPRAGP
jgi:hypothetical protein